MDSRPQQARKKVTLKDISLATGFSVNTISHALANKPDISASTKQLIQDKAAELGYVGNSSASYLRSGISKTVAVMLGDVSNPHFAFMAKEIENYLQKAGYSSFFMNTSENEQIERNCIRLALNRNVDGIIICPAQQSASNVRFILNSGVPCVLIGRYFKELSTNYVTCNDSKGGYLAGKHLVERGHRQIMYVNTYYHNSSSEDRLSGFHQALEEASTPVSVYETKFDEQGKYLDDIFPADPNAPHPTAMVAFNDVIAWDVICRMQARGLHYPKNLSMIGFDNLHAYLPLPFPLTSISSSKITLSRKAVERLLEQIQNPGTACSGLILDVELIDRGSVLDLTF